MTKKKKKAPNGGFEEMVRKYLTRIYLTYSRARLLVYIRDNIHEHMYYPWNVRKSSLRKLHNILPNERSEYIKINDAIEQIVPAYVQSVSRLAWYLHGASLMKVYRDVLGEDIVEEELYLEFRTNLDVDKWYDTFRKANTEDAEIIALLDDGFFKEPEKIILLDDVWKLQTLQGDKGKLVEKIIDETTERIMHAIEIRKTFVPGKRDIEKAMKGLGIEHKANFAPISVGDLAQMILDL